ncbi:MvdC/MvdD family ATP grasp protein [Plantactinospora endophytica]|uniref:ATP-grasp ribosomal peptide maturase n=1 Tax=Plantactinospora endophytica TaxID=673535 RepID=A0ABQ4E9B4_9ACTN|nr:ATP-dependent carboxylate-amine ligase [Plantactinospora endophytica]GIG91313.1 ATP-grasp ribosomal peptide maturase [Plantactinospora endophytica]
MSPPAPVVLILTQDFDPTVDPVVQALGAKGADVVRVDVSYFPRKMTFTASDFDGDRRRLRHRDRDIDLDRLSGVWYRRPTAFDFGAEMGQAEKQFARNEALHGVGGLLRATDCLWVNRPDIDATAELKPYQLTLAKKLGLRVPRTLITNDPQEVAELLARAERPIVYKAFSGGVVHYPGAFPSGLLTTVVGDELREHLGRVQHTMCMFQEYVEKAYEVRLTVIGNTYFPVCITSQDLDTTRVDWRGENMLPYGDYRPLPDEVIKKVQALLAELDLVYAAVDFIVTPDGEYVFLEVNPAGQFMWMYHDLGIPFSDSLADLLMTGGPFRRGDVTQVSY